MDLKYLMPVIAYLLGSIPVGWIVARLFYQKDIRTEGSGNIGATNALRIFGTKVGLIVLILDMLKGIIAVLLARHLFSAEHPLVALCGLLAILGHIFPVWLRFKGGKGVATAGGVFLALSPLSLLIALISFVLIVAKTRYVSLGSIIGSLIFGLSIVVQQLTKDGVNWALLALTGIVVLMIIIKHRQNIQRLWQGRENKISFKKKGKS
ncbi:MAG: glycerol-3-phosphate 1-O-acyltransferase PlsY [Candidatus Cloacimonadaceae bacterium]|jgi:glycerol-3-phosphate acyltransferase PlsY|nr:glycerol-3-phosphate 1-O-acyltransferase PlsY [Candidatus Cloacimonadota bacterium]MDY0127565.1 glycerol-3-phosphate 1-O-acyltransferase PlsY [Candidatus Cloacimonadaceae bacterium]MCB5254592.1 glycerol-3-phosphate 1-O-acyltransferase PlsY [Candidatus Cloacimonadota bacterium]MCK9178243.1 glycerol-3-phosphate 1-O-acyltransferase PlsY [Candidatus Cloacimonadota bacterium]MCK9242531.1 glycerol-3-phosphate 1-O-acyltransferase PlsY [Candidatus Cloacimonadota bacterium]